MMENLGILEGIIRLGDEHMILVSIALHSTITRRTSSLGQIRIWNDGTGTQKRGNYKWNIYARNGRLLKSGELSNWPRQSKTAMALVQRIINTSYPQGIK